MFEKEYDADDYRDSKEFIAAKQQVSDWLKKRKSATVGEISRQFTAHRRWLWEILKNLQSDGRVYFNESAANITRIEYQEIVSIAPQRKTMTRHEQNVNNAKWFGVKSAI